MSDVLCRVCGEPWDTYHISRESPAWVAPLFFAGAGCESCEGVGSGESAEKSDQSLVIDGDGESDPLEMRPALMGEKPPAWKRPPDPTVWQCAGCKVSILRDLDWRDGSEFAFRVGGAHTYRDQRDLGIANCDTFSTLDEARETVSVDGEACHLCAAKCEGCGTVCDRVDLYPDPLEARYPYIAGTVCTECYSERQWEAACEYFSARDLCDALGIDRHRLDGLNVSLGDVPSEWYDITEEGTHYRNSISRTEIARWILALRRGER